MVKKFKHRVSAKKEKEYDLDPEIKKPSKRKRSSPAEDLGVSKSLYRVLNANQIRAEYKEKKAKKEQENREKQKAGDAKKLKLAQGESLSQFNSRVEREMKGEVIVAIKKARQKDASVQRQLEKEKQARKEKARKDKARKDRNEPDDAAQDEPQEPQAPEGPEEPPKEFAPADLRRPVNDVVDAPPMLTLSKSKDLKLKPQRTVRKDQIPLTKAQRDAIEAERNEAIRMYRELKGR